MIRMDDQTTYTAFAGHRQIATGSLRAMLLATFQAPLQQFLQQLSAPSQNFAYLLKAREAEQQEPNK